MQNCLSSAYRFRTIMIVLVTSFWFAGCSRFGYLPLTGAAQINDNGAQTQTTPTTKTPITTVTAGAATRLLVNGPNAIPAGTCAPYTVTALDASGNLAQPLSGGAMINLAGFGSGRFSLDGNCTSTSYQVPIGGANTITVYFTDSHSEPLTFLAQSSTGLTGQLPVTILAGSASTISVSGPQSVAKEVCRQYTAQILDAYGNPTTISTATSLSLRLSGTASDGAYSFLSPDCSTGSEASAVPIPAGMGSQSFYLLPLEEGGLTVTVAGPSPLNPGSLFVTVNPGPNQAIIFTAAASATAGDCIQGRVNLQKTNGDAWVSPVNLPIALRTGNPSSMVFYAGTTCTGNPVTSLVVPNGSAFVNFRYRDTRVEMPTVYGSSPGLVTGSFSTDIHASSLSQVVVGIDSGSLPAGQCGMGHLYLKDSFGNDAPATNQLNLPVIASGSSGSTAGFFSNSGCTAPLANSRITISNGVASQAFYFNSTTPGQLTIDVTPPNGATSLPATLEITTTLGTPYQIVFTAGPGSVSAGQCATYQIESRTAGGLPVLVASDVTLNLRGSVPLNTTFYAAGTQCGTPVNWLRINQGSASGSFSMRYTGVGSFDLFASNGNLSTSKTISSSAGATSKLLFSGSNVLNAGECIPQSVNVADDYGNTTSASARTYVALSGFYQATTGSLSFYTDSICSQFVSGNTVAIAQGTSTTTFYIGASLGGAAALLGQSDSLNSASKTISIGAARPLHLVYTSPTAVNVGECVPLSVAVFDNTGFPAPYFSPQTLTLSGGAAGGRVLFKDSACSTHTSVLNITDTTNPSQFFVKDTVSEPIVVSGSSVTGLSFTTSVTFRPGTPTQIHLDIPTQVFAGICTGGYQITLLDAYGNVTSAPHGPISFVSTVYGTVFSAYSNCSGTGNSVTVPDGASSQTFYVMVPSPGSVSVTGSGSGIAQNTQTYTVYANGLQFLVQNLNFGSQTVGTPATLPMVLRNTGALSVTLNSLTQAGDANYVVSGMTCTSGLVIPPGSQCGFNVTFTPGTTGVHSGTMTAQTNAGVVTGSFTGYGIPAATPPSFGLTPSQGNGTLDFGAVTLGRDSTLDYWLTNNGQTIGTVTSFTTSDGRYTVVTGGTCGALTNVSVAPSASCSVKVKFKPDAVGRVSATLYVNAAVGGTSGSMTGVGMTQGAIVFNPASGLNFPDAVFPSSRNACEAVGNSGQTPLTFHGASWLWNQGFTVTNGCDSPCNLNGGTLAPGAWCNITVNFNPNDEGVRRDWLTVNYDTAGIAGSAAFSNVGATTRPLTCQSDPGSTIVVSIGQYYNGATYLRSDQVWMNSVANRPMNIIGSGYTVKFNGAPGGDFVPNYGAYGANNQNFLMGGTFGQPGDYQVFVNIQDRAKPAYTATCGYHVVVVAQYRPVTQIVVNGVADGDLIVCNERSNGTVTFNLQPGAEARWFAAQVNEYYVYHYYRPDEAVLVERFVPVKINDHTWALPAAAWASITGSNPVFTSITPSWGNDTGNGSAWNTATRSCVKLNEGAGGKPGTVNFSMNLNPTR